MYSGHDPSPDEIVVHRSRFGEGKRDLVKDRQGHPDLASVEEVFEAAGDEVLPGSEVWDQE
jgi:hypothetical protein